MAPKTNSTCIFQPCIFSPSVTKGLKDMYETVNAKQ